LLFAMLATGLQMGQYDRSGGEWVEGAVEASRRQSDAYSKSFHHLPMRHHSDTLPSRRKHASSSPCILHEPSNTWCNTDSRHDRSIPHKQWAVPRRLDVVWHHHPPRTFDRPPPQPKAPRSVPRCARMYYPTNVMVVDLTYGPTIFCDTWSTTRHLRNWRLSAAKAVNDESDHVEVRRVR
jgi:hypothetical protein